MKSFGTKIKRIIPSEEDQPEVRNFKIIIYSIIGIIVLMIITGVAAFFFTLQRTEQTMVPEVEGLELIDAILELQERELNPRIQLRYSSDPNSKGQVLNQRPDAGTTVKLGRQIHLTVSQGAILDHVEDYRGQNLDEVRSSLQALFTTYQPLLEISDVVYKFDSAPAGTILEQSPEPGTEIAGLTELDFVVSRGADVEEYKVPSYVGMYFEEAVALLARANIPFVFSLAGEDSAGEDGHVTGQTPEAGSSVKPGTPLRLEMLAPADTPEESVFGLFERVLPDYPAPVEITFDTVDPDGTRTTQFSMLHPGGRIVIPYIEEPNTTFIITVGEQEAIRYIVPAPIETEES
jgi:beta-lactam-binding protein with PASTA domain